MTLPPLPLPQTRRPVTSASGSLTAAVLRLRSFCQSCSSCATQRFCGLRSAISFYVCVALRAICAVLFGRALGVQLDSIEDDRVHGESKMLIPLVFCGTWMRPPSPTEEAASVGQSEWSSVQPVSVSVSSQVACKFALGVGTSEFAVSAYASTCSLPNNSKFSSLIQNLPEAAIMAVMIRMPSPALRHLKDREGPSYNPARLDNALLEF